MNNFDSNIPAGASCIRCGDVLSVCECDIEDVGEGDNCDELEDDTFIKTEFEIYGFNEKWDSLMRKTYKYKMIASIANFPSIIRKIYIYKYRKILKRRTKDFFLKYFK